MKYSLIDHQLGIFGFVSLKYCEDANLDKIDSPLMQSSLLVIISWAIYLLVLDESYLVNFVCIQNKDIDVEFALD